MKLLTFLTGERKMRAGILSDNMIIALEYPTLLELLRDPDGLLKAQVVLHPKPLTGPTYPAFTAGLPVVLGEFSNSIAHTQGTVHEEYTLNEVVMLPPVPDPPTVRDFYAFEQHVKTARAHRGLDMMPEWYEVPTFYFTNNSELYGHDNPIPYPVGSHALDFELEIACVIGRDGKDIPVEEAASYIAGYTIMNDWSARDFQQKDMSIGLGPGKGKDFATSLGPILVTLDELASRRTGQGASERYDMPMVARINGREVSRGNFNSIYYSFPQMIAYASRNARIRTGDVIGSGTVGTGCILELGTEVHRWLERDDEVELEIDGIGILRNRII
jgi:fumarylacetoacetate (FAA) hydrolase